MIKRWAWVNAVLVIFASFILSQSIKPGKLNKEWLLSSFPGFQIHFQNYQPQPEVIQDIEAWNEYVRIEIYLRTDCELNAELAAAFAKTMELSENPYIESDYFRLPSDLTQSEKYFLGKNITKSPTFIIYDGNSRELGRIAGSPLKSMEQDLMDILSAPPPDDYSLDYDFFMNNYHADLDVNCAECHLP
jgi:hypothetical protein